MTLSHHAALFPVLWGVRDLGSISRNITKGCIRDYVLATFPKPDGSIWHIERQGPSLAQLVFVMNFQVMVYRIYGTSWAERDSGERRPTGQLYNEGPNIRLEVLSVSEILTFMPSKAN